MSTTTYAVRPQPVPAVRRPVVRLPRLSVLALATAEAEVAALQDRAAEAMR